MELRICALTFFLMINRWCGSDRSSTKSRSLSKNSVTMRILGYIFTCQICHMKISYLEFRYLFLTLSCFISPPPPPSLSLPLLLGCLMTSTLKVCPFVCAHWCDYRSKQTISHDNVRFYFLHSFFSPSRIYHSRSH